MLLGVPEIALIVIVIVIFFFGGKKVKEWARVAGQAKGEFSKATKEIKTTTKT